MALMALMLRKKIDSKNSELAEARKALKEIEAREAEIEKAIEETAAMPESTDEEIASKREAEKVTEESVEAYEGERKEAESRVETLSAEVSELETELEQQETETPPEEKSPAAEERTVAKMDTIEKFFGMSMQERDAFFAREDVQVYLGEVRAAIKEKRALNNVGLTIPEVFLGVLRENIADYSKLYKHVYVQRISGTGREVIMGSIPEAIWTECCGTLNELSLDFYDMEVDCFKVGGYYSVCNATLEDSDLNLATEIMTALGQSIGYALDKAILYGRNTNANQKMPLGIVSRLAQTSEPAGYSPTARPWVNLSTTNIQSIAAGTTGADLISAIVRAFAAAKGKYSRGEKVFVMNESTYTKLGAATVTTAADGSIVTGIFDRMPVVGGIIEVLDIPDNVIIGGYFDLYLLGERAGQQFATSEHVKFLQDATVMKGTARYDGAPRIAEAFVAIGIEGTTPTADMTFAADTANTGA